MPPMSPVAQAPATGQGRPATVTVAAVVLMVLAAGGLIYAVVTLAVLPGVLDRFRTAARGTASTDAEIDGFVAVLWAGAVAALVLAAAVAALLVVLALALRRGSNGARIATWVLCALGVLGGLLALVVGLLQRAVQVDLPGDGLGAALTQAYPSGWVPGNAVLALLQALGYGAVAVLLALPMSAAFFRRWRGSPG